MRMTAELSLYPLSENYEAIVLSFIDRLLEQQPVSAVTNSMSTQVTGESAAVFSAIQAALEASYATFGKQVLVAKFIPEHFVDIEPAG
ncbi:YkoF family thiamine/hydroxymethylpyrimidine-binding protein [Luminiphilus syltensis]|uniref:YkoF family thiamine/hydroxymethylpyrimidine-binding protein n=1 Tax=Luminiphilus syltensis TaxID=1341119 RepID=UPI0002E2A625|nr:YkoF family thiamine/hydroxymethylpyrimidine-binding protein [Luminiphilus syltensis]